ncbi:hypothetical protein BHE74_00036992 [Ensete ventricosum]|nr:hypothetical protein BHE74_00036992 [Ensete ventricosum]
MVMRFQHRICTNVFIVYISQADLSDVVMLVGCKLVIKLTGGLSYITFESSTRMGI